MLCSQFLVGFQESLALHHHELVGCIGDLSSCIVGMFPKFAADVNAYLLAAQRDLLAFDDDMDAVQFCTAHGLTVDNGEIHRRSTPTEMVPRVEWKRCVLRFPRKLACL